MNSRALASLSIRRSFSEGVAVKQKIHLTAPVRRSFSVGVKTQRHEGFYFLAFHSVFPSSRLRKIHLTARMPRREDLPFPPSPRLRHTGTIHYSLFTIHHSRFTIHASHHNVPKLFPIISTASFISSSVITKGGAKRILSP